MYIYIYTQDAASRDGPGGPERERGRGREARGVEEGGAEREKHESVLTTQDFALNP